MIFRNWVLQNFPFLEDDFDALTDYELFCKMLEYMKKSLEKINDFQNEINGFEIKLNEFQHYFDNLDVTEEVNAKLDEMADDGTLTELIAEYLQLTTTYTYNNVSEMKSSENLVNGCFARTSGYHTYNDGGGAFYKIRTITSEDDIDEMFIIALNNINLVAELIIYDKINVLQLGAYRDREHDIAPYFQAGVNKVCEIGGTLYIPYGLYALNTPIVFPQSEQNMVIDGGLSELYVNLDTNDVYAIDCRADLSTNKYMRLQFRDFNLKNVSTETVNGIYFQHTTQRELLNNVLIQDFNIGLRFNMCWNVSFKKLMLSRNFWGLYAPANSEFNAVNFEDCIFYSSDGTDSKLVFNLYDGHSVNFTECDFTSKNEFRDCFGITFTNCYYEDASDHRINPFAFYNCEGVQFNGSYFRLENSDADYVCFYISNSSINFDGCFFHQARTGLTSETVINAITNSNINVIGCSFKDITGNAIYVSSSQLHVYGNKISNVYQFLNQRGDTSYINGDIATNSDYTNSYFRVPNIVNLKINNVLEYGTTANIPSGYYIGQQYFDTTTNTLKVYNGSNWV